MKKKELPTPKSISSLHNMGSRAFFMLRATSSTSPLLNTISIYKSSLLFSKKAFIIKSTVRRSYTVRSSLDPPDLNRLAQTSRISLTPDEIEEFAPKIQQVAALKKINAIGTGDDLLTWFGQLQGVDLQSVRPSIRADFEGQNMRDDLPETFGNREQMIAAVPNFEDPFIKVPKVLNKE